ncbi:hypothetical protein [Hymenobacter cellulosilyticus]|uniref:Uncharacterized protein n=1 Tax=Hymenobacter cellulosilyticus TaxID=2932248 RepID=A0A8T9Q2W7_9BACT|nr:hypothetical protein [Hymenobacter cellulosilyticus]UOQ71375.1 hypothetical protein MUN79_22550 [Hymenobacter cellulosilyticus]
MGESTLEKVLVVLEKVAWPFALFGFIGKWNLLDGADGLLLLGLTNLSLVYLVRAFLPDEPVGDGVAEYTGISTSPEPTFWQEVMSPKILGISSALVFVGIEFKAKAWDGGTYMLLAGTGTVVLVILLQALQQRLSQRALLTAVLGASMLYVTPETLVRQFHQDDPVLVEKMLHQLAHPQDKAAAAAVTQHERQKRLARYE